MDWTHSSPNRLSRALLPPQHHSVLHDVAHWLWGGKPTDTGVTRVRAAFSWQISERREGRIDLFFAAPTTVFAF